MNKKKLVVLITLLVLFGCIVGACSSSKENSEEYEALKKDLKGELEYSSETVLPDYYGGCYRDEEQNLVVCVIADEDYSKNCKLIKKCVEDEEVVIQKVDYSYHELLQAHEKAGTMYHELYQQYVSEDFSSKESDLLISMSGTYVDVISNRLVVEIKEPNDDKIQTFKEIFFDEEYVEFVEGFNNSLEK